MIRIKIFLLMLIAIILNSCTHKIVLQSEYKKLSIKNSHLAVSFIDTPKIHEPSFVQRGLGPIIGDTIETYIDFMKKSVIKNFKKRTFLDVNQFDKENTLNLKIKEYKLSKNDTIKIKIPTDIKEENNNFHGIDFLLVFQNVEIGKGKGRVQFTSANGLPGGFGPNQDRFIHSGEFYIWDIKNMRIVSYGKFKTDMMMGLLNPMGRNWWEKSVNQIVIDIVLKSPFITKSSVYFKK